MTKQIEAIYEGGIIRPLEPLKLPEGTQLDIIIITHEKSRAHDNAAEILAEIAGLPLEGAGDSFSGWEHDSILCSSPKK